MKLALLTTVWKRHALTRVTLRRYANMRRYVPVELDLLAVGSEGDVSQQLVEAEGWRYLEAPNDSLGAKWNAGFRALADTVADAVVFIGSDDWVTNSLAVVYADALSRGKRFIGWTDLFFVHPGYDHGLYWPGYTVPHRRGEAIGLGRCLHRSVLDEVDWAPLRTNVPPGHLDYTMMQDLGPLIPDEQRLVGSMGELGLVAFDVKGVGENIGGWQAFERDAVQVDREQLFGAFPEYEIDELQQVLVDAAGIEAHRPARDGQESEDSGAS